MDLRIRLCVIKDTSGLHLYRVRPSHSFTRPPPAVRLPPARGERDHQAAAAHQASAAPSAAAAAAAAAYPTPRQQQPQQTTQRQQQQQTTRRLQSTQRSSAQRSSGSSSTSSSSTSSRPPEARLAFVHPLWPQVADTGGVAQGKIKRKRGENNNEEDKKDAKPVGSLTPM